MAKFMRIWFNYWIMQDNNEFEFEFTGARKHRQNFMQKNRTIHLLVIKEGCWLALKQPNCVWERLCFCMCVVRFHTVYAISDVLYMYVCLRYNDSETTHFNRLLLVLRFINSIWGRFSSRPYRILPADIYTKCACSFQYTLSVCD